MFKKFRKKSCTYLSMLRTTVTNFAPKRHRMLPGEKRQISDSKFKFSDLICCQKFVFFPQGAYDVFSVRNLSRWCVAYSGTCMIFRGIFRKVFDFLNFVQNTGCRCTREPKRLSRSYVIANCRYADSTNAYWTGYFTSRPTFKRYVRMLSGYYLV